jgi:hypothetical protein
MLDVVTAAPNMPVRAHMPTNENVICGDLRSRKRGDRKIRARTTESLRRTLPGVHDRMRLL